MNERLGVVAIGRNEGDRLRRCLKSLVGPARPVVYVDSGSTDGSVAFARSIGATVVELDRGTPFTAARARNLGFAKLRDSAPDLEFVQFVDGDCEVVAGWLERALAELRADPSLAVVCGRRRERYPDASLYNRLCDLEWDTPIGDAEACGGDAMMRVQPLHEVGGYNPELIAGEEPELCLRLRQRGWRIRRIDAEMTLHDAAITSFGQWWKRTLRGGHAYAEAAGRHGHEPGHAGVRDSLSIWFWAAGVPAAALGLAPFTLGGSLALLGGYPVLAARIYKGGRQRGLSERDAALYSASCVVGKAPQLLGQILYWKKRLRGEQGSLIEYKGPETPEQSASATS